MQPPRNEETRTMMEKHVDVQLVSFKQMVNTRAPECDIKQDIEIEVVVEEEAVEEFDPWKLPEVNVEVISWSELSTSAKCKRILWDFIGKILVLLISLYLFVCSLDFLSNSFRLIGGKTAGKVFQNSRLLRNPVTGLMMGVLMTSILQSSSTTNGVAISLVISGILDVQGAIPIVMGANIGTSVTSTIISLGQVGKKNEFRRAFACATVHDMFNWLSVLVLLPLEAATGYLYHLTKAIMSTMNFGNQDGNKKKVQFLKTITKPFTSRIIQLDTKLIQDIAQGKEDAASKSLVKHCCETVTEQVEQWNTSTSPLTNTSSEWPTEKRCIRKCYFLFEDIANTWSDTTVGGVLLVLSIFLLSMCFLALVKTLFSMMKGHILIVLKKFINSNFPGKLAFLTPYVAIVIGCVITFLVQSSSVITSSLTPLVGIGILSLERTYPLTCGSNLGSSFLAILIAGSQSIEDMPAAFQIALCHIFFNITGILMFYPIPFMRLPIRVAKFLGNTTAKYRWFCMVYLLGMFILFPAVVFGLSTISAVALTAVLSPVAAALLAVLVINGIQSRRPTWLPVKLRTWKFLPVWMRSLEPYDRIFSKFTCRRCDDRDNL